MPTTAPRPATHDDYSQIAPQAVDPDGARTWMTRGANFLVAVTDAKAGTVLSRENNTDEYMLILPPGVPATIRAGSEVVDSGGDTLTIIPAGASEVRLSGAGLAARIFSRHAADLLGRASNAAAYADGAPEVAPLEPWPAPTGGFRLRHYELARYYDPAGPRMQPRVFRSTNMMVNVFGVWATRRDTAQLSPHWHDDFEQGSLSFTGQLIHHLRYPWTQDMARWRDDDHVRLGSPSVTIMPAMVTHTTQDVGTEDGLLVDIFAPPRLDFSLKPGFVLNADEYPLPDGAANPGSTRGTLMSWQQTS